MTDTAVEPQLQESLGSPVHLAHGNGAGAVPYPSDHTYCGVPTGGRSRSPGNAAAVTCAECIVAAESRCCPQCGLPAGFPL